MRHLFNHIGRSLAHRNFRLFFIGQTISLTGSWMQQVALSWLVFQMTNSSFWLGMTLFLGQIPCLFLPPVIGVWVDRWDRRKALLVTQTAAMFLAFFLAGLVLTDRAALWHLMALSFLSGIVVSFDMPTRQAFLSEMVPDPQDFPNAVAMNATMFNGARLFGPALAGLVLAETSAGICFLLNGASFLAVLISLFMIRVPKRLFSSTESSVTKGLLEGLVYAWRFPPLRNILLLMSLGCLAGSGATVLMPEYTTRILGGDAQTLGWLGSALGCGALAAALFLASRKTILGYGQWIGSGIAIMGLGLLALPHVSSLFVSLSLFFLIGFGMIVHIAAGNTILQTASDESKRGRIMGLYTIAIVGFAPVGNLLTGFLAEKFGLLPTLSIAGFLSIVGGFAFLLWLPYLHEHVRPVYVRLRILPQDPPMS